ncbi:MAG TPA: Gfo/Idh/MocA family oxidoreductase [Anaerolineales bacterium]|nr:Gfo/Idh/MocA family oxidoreductase [Anaerolineales bacterium]
MSNKLRVGIVGTSGWAEFMYLPALQSHPQAEITAICGRNRSSVEHLAAKYNISNVFTDYKEMINQGGFDAILIGTPDDLHYEMTLQGLDAGLHVLCDKPLAVTAKQAWEMYQAAENAKVIHMVLFTYRWMPFFRYVKDLIDQGYVGRCYHAEFRYLMGYARQKEYQWRFDQKRANGALGDLGVHMIDMARWLVGNISQVCAQLGVFVERPGADGGPIVPANDSALLLTEFANGTHGAIQASVVAHLADREMQQQVKLYGEAGTLEIDVPYGGPQAGAVIRAARNDDQQFQTLGVPANYWGDVSQSNPWEVFNHQSAGCRAFIDGILENHLVTPTFYDGYKAQQVMEAAMDSHRSAKCVSIEDSA